MASKKLVIKGADFSANGFSIVSQTIEITDMFLADGTEYSYGTSIAQSDAMYYYSENNVLKRGLSFAGVAGNPVNLTSQNYIDVEGCVSVTYKGRLSTYARDASRNMYGLYIGFLDSSKNLIGGVCNAPVGTQGQLCECIDGTSTIIEFTKDIPSGCKYIVASCNFNSQSVEGESFKISLHKETIE